MLISEIRKINRNVGTRCFEKLVGEGFLIKDYFIITTTRRPVQCFAKILPTTKNERDTMSKKLVVYDITLAKYIESSRTNSIPTANKLSSAGTALLSKPPYNSLNGNQPATANDQYDTPLASTITIDTNQETTSSISTAITTDQTTTYSSRTRSQTKNTVS